MTINASDHRTLAPWATTTGRPRPRLVRGLAGDIQRLLAGARWSGPQRGTTDSPASRSDTGLRSAGPPATGLRSVGLSATGPRATGLRRTGLPGRIAWALPGIQLDGPAPAQLPAGPVILVANHPTASAADMVLARLDPARRARTLVVTTPQEHVGLLSSLRRRRLRLDFDKPGGAGVRLANLLGEGRSVLIFPEGLPAAGVAQRPFHSFAADLADQTGLPVVPVGIRGARAVRVTPGTSRVSIRFGDPLHPGADARDQEAAVNGLIAEDGATWWAVQRSDPGHLPGTRTPQTAHTWRHVWAQTARPQKGGVAEPPRIWRSTR